MLVSKPGVTGRYVRVAPIFMGGSKIGQNLKRFRDDFDIRQTHGYRDTMGLLGRLPMGYTPRRNAVTPPPIYLLL